MIETSGLLSTLKPIFADNERAFEFALSPD
jgi:hypothetical protein